MDTKMQALEKAFIEVRNLTIEGAKCSLSEFENSYCVDWEVKNSSGVTEFDFADTSPLEKDTLCKCGDDRLRYAAGKRSDCGEYFYQPGYTSKTFTDDHGGYDHYEFHRFEIIETATGIESVSRFLECAIRDGYTILLITQERRTK